MLPANMDDEGDREWLGLSIPNWCAIVAGVILLGSFFSLLTMGGPKKIDNLQVPTALNGDQWKLSGEITEIEERYKELAWDSPVPAGIVAAIERAIRQQEQLIGITPQTGIDQRLRLERLHVAQDTLKARHLLVRVAELEGMIAAGPSANPRLVLLTELFKLRREINGSRAVARYKDLVSETRLERELESVEARPLREEADQIMAQAKHSAALRNWAVAHEHFTRAREIMDDVNQRFARTRYADIGMRSRLWTEELALQGADAAAEVDVFEQGGDEAAATKRPEAAARYFQQARDQQKELNERWPKSRFVSTYRLEMLEVKRQTVLWSSLSEAIAATDQEVTSLLASRQTLAAERRIKVLLLEVGLMTTDFPKANRSDDGLEEKYRYLATLGEGIRALQDRIYDQLVPLPGTEGVAMSRTEVLQELYSDLMKFNPSRNLGAQLPADSISWGDAMEFCRRISWVLGRPVRLPDRHELLSARGSNDAEEVNLNGYQGILSGISEWLSAPATAAEAGIALGDRRPTINQEEGAAFATAGKEFRFREVGFRVVVETGER